MQKTHQKSDRLILINTATYLAGHYLVQVKEEAYKEYIQIATGKNNNRKIERKQKYYKETV
jgi:hypothetical protein